MTILRSILPRREPFLRSRLASLKRVKSPVVTGERKLHLDAKASTQSQALPAPSQPEIPGSANASTSTALTPEKDLSQPDSPPEPTVEPSMTTSQPKAEAGETNAPKLYFEVGTFKDETWANNAVDKLTHLGFHAVLIHKNLLWTQSFHVEVGPYTNAKRHGGSAAKPRFSGLQGSSRKLISSPRFISSRRNSIPGRQLLSKLSLTAESGCRSAPCYRD